MIVADLVEKLKTLDPALEVVLFDFDQGSPYGAHYVLAPAPEVIGVVPDAEPGQFRQIGETQTQNARLVVAL